MSDTTKFREIFDYLSAPRQPADTNPVVVFGREDPLVAQAAGHLASTNLAEVIVITGGIGKNSGDILELGHDSEATYLNFMLEKDAVLRGYALPTVHLDKKASSGKENARNSLDILEENRFCLNSLTVVAHATSLRRLSETLRHETKQKTQIDPEVSCVASKYNFDPASPTDQNEALAELLRLFDWPSKGLLEEQADLPLDLVDFARESHIKTPRQPSPMVSKAFRILPKTAQVKIARHFS